MPARTCPHLSPLKPCGFCRREREPRHQQYLARLTRRQQIAKLLREPEPGDLALVLPREFAAEIADLIDPPDAARLSS